MVVFGVGVNEVLNVHKVDRKFAQAKLEECQQSHLELFRLAHLIPVVTATCPNKLNQPVIQDASGAFFGSDNIAAQK
jgi:hypothetical protein